MISPILGPPTAQTGSGFNSTSVRKSPTIRRSKLAFQSMRPDIATALDAPDSVLDEQEQRFVQSIRKPGWIHPQIFAESDYPAFSFTTGFWIGHGFPEVIVFSMPPNIAHDVLWHIYRMISNGSPPPIGELTSTIYANRDALLLPVARKHYQDHPGWNRWFYGNDEFTCLQLLRPDKDGVFPGHPDAGEVLNLAQPDLSCGASLS